ncbi:MAG TPA: 4-(cytidine 5'-diphospho)-2-C-methyl-D-erythritol kinase [Verrucomicrobiae bacterium]|jgi:4-diphosphocytidyl-2-C-methyl-D-erythritol kinase
MSVERLSPCKVNLLLNILGKRLDGFHELETVMQPVPVHDRLTFDAVPTGIHLTCTNSELPTGAGNLVHKATVKFFQATQINSGVRIHLEKNIPLSAGLGGGSGNAAHTLLGLNELYQRPLDAERLSQLAAELGSDVPFFLQSNPALATGRGENVESLKPFPSLQGAWILLIHPGFGIATAWAYQQLAKFPTALNGQPGRALELVGLLMAGDLAEASRHFYNSLEAPALKKYPILVLFQEFLRENGAAVTLMSGSGSTTFALTTSRESATLLRERFVERFGLSNWTAIAPLG